MLNFLTIIYVPFLAVFTNPSSPFTTFSTIVLVGKHKKTREVCEANLAGVEQAKAPLSVKYLILFFDSLRPNFNVFSYRLKALRIVLSG